MSIEKCLRFKEDGFGNWDDSAKPTTPAQMYQYTKNQNNVLLQLASKCWQPGTSYSIGDVVSTSSMGGYFARCTKAGKSSDAEPTWKKDGSTTDGTVTWAVYRLVLADMLESLIAPIILKRFPVGTIIESEKNVNPGTYIGGTWELMPAGYVTISAGTYTETQDGKAVAYNFEAGETYGEAAHKLTVGEIPSLSVAIASASNTVNNVAPYGRWSVCCANVPNAEPYAKQYVGGVYTNNSQKYADNLQPSKAVYRFRRIA